MPVNIQFYCETCSGWFTNADFESHIDANPTHVLAEKYRYVEAGQEDEEVGGGTSAPPASKYASAANVSYHVTSSISTSATSSTNYSVVNSMSYTPEAGQWLVLFSASGLGSNSSNAEMFVAAFKGGIIVSDSERSMGRNSRAANRATVREFTVQTVIETNGSEAIDIRYKTTKGTFTVENRSLILVRIGG